MRHLASRGLSVEIVSGDRRPVVRMLAARLGINQVAADLLPAGKLARIEQLARSGRKILMVGDGLNDAPALSAAHASMAPATAADIGRNAADFVFLNESLSAVTEVLDISRKAGTLIRQNFGLAVAYNAMAVPIAIGGYVTPLLAALAMSLSSVLVVANALRLRNHRSIRFPGALLLVVFAKSRCGHGSMNYLVVLVPLAILMGVVGLAAFLWSLRSGQYEDLDGAAERVLLDDEDKP